MLIIYPTSKTFDEVFPEGSVTPTVRELLKQYYGTDGAILRMFFETKRDFMDNSGIGLSRFVTINERLLSVGIAIFPDGTDVEDRLDQEFASLDTMPAMLYTSFCKLIPAIDDIIVAMNKSYADISLKDLINLNRDLTIEEIVAAVDDHLPGTWSAGDIAGALEEFEKDFDYFGAATWALAAMAVPA